MFLMFWEVQKLTRSISSLEKRKIEKLNELTALQEYTGMLAGTSILNISNIAGLSPELQSRAMSFGRYSDQASSMSAMQNIQNAINCGTIPNNVDQNTKMQMIRQAFINFKEQALKALKEQEKIFLSKRDKEIQLELNELTASLKMEEAELESCKQRAMEQAQEAGRIFG